jgi:hypothetical protein
MDWSVRSGSTPSSGTGPSSAYEGTYYAYMESSSPNYPSKTAFLKGPSFDLTGRTYAEMMFQYHMYGSYMGTLYVEISDNCENWTELWSLSGNQGNNWYFASIDLSPYIGQVITVRFRGVTGSNYTGDMAIDDIAVYAE